jgi:hypothetical protein
LWGLQLRHVCDPPTRWRVPSRLYRRMRKCEAVTGKRGYEPLP